MWEGGKKVTKPKNLSRIDAKRIIYSDIALYYIERRTHNNPRESPGDAIRQTSNDGLAAIWDKKNFKNVYFACLENSRE